MDRTANGIIHRLGDQANPVARWVVELPAAAVLGDRMARSLHAVDHCIESRRVGQYHREMAQPSRADRRRGGADAGPRV